MRLRAPIVVLLVILSLLLTPHPTEAQTQQRTFEDLGYGDRTARTMLGSLDYFFPIPAGSTAQAGGRLLLHFSHSTLLEPEISTLTVVVNGRSLASTLLTSQNAANGRLSVDLPPEQLTGGGIFVQIQLFMRLTRDECEETQNPALWATIHQDSQLQLALRPAADPTLQQLPGLLMPADGPLSFVLPADPQQQELEAAGLIAFQIGRWSQGRDVPELEVVGQVPASAPSAVIMRGEQLSGWDGLRWEGGALVGEQGRTSQGLLAVAADPAPQLLVSGGSPDAVLDAAQALAAPAGQTLVPTDTLVVSSTPLTSTDAGPWAEGAASFYQLGLQERRRVEGPGLHVLDLTFERPAGWQIGEGATLQIALASAASLRPETSWVEVAVNGFELGSQRIAPGRSPDDQRYSFTLPADLLNTDVRGRPQRLLALQLRIFLDIPEDGCVQVPAASSWAALLPTSAWLLPHTEQAGTDLGRYPAGLLEREEPLAVVLPDRPDADELAAGLELMATLGRWSAQQTTAQPRLLRASQLDQRALGTTNLVLLGAPERNILSAQAAQQQPALFAQQQPAMAPFSSQQTALIAIGRSPWSAEHSLLVIPAANGGGLLAATAALRDDAIVTQLSGGSALVSPALPPQTLSAAEPAGQAPESLAPRVIIPPTQRIATWQVIGAVVMGAFIAALLIILAVRYRRRGR